MPEKLQRIAEPPAGDANLAQTIANAKRELEQMMDLNPQGMLLLDVAGRISRVNRAIVDLAGVGGFDALLGQPFAKVFADGDESFASALVQREGGAESLERCVTLPNGFKRELRFTTAGTTSGVQVIIVADITGEKERLASEEKALKQEAITALIGGLMHNINQPLTVLSVTAKLMEMGLQKEPPDADELRQNLSTISDLVMQIKAVLEKVESASDYVTEEYLAGRHILDIGKL